MRNLLSTSDNSTGRLSLLRFGLILSLIPIASCLGTGSSCPAAVESADSVSFPNCQGKVPTVKFLKDTSIPHFNQPQTVADTEVSLIRITQNGDAKEKSQVHRHHYSRRQAWNADETLLDLNSILVDATSFKPHEAGNPLSSERTWANTDADLLIGIRYNPKATELASYNVQTLEYSTLQRFDAYEHCTLGHGEGNLSLDDSRIVVTCSDTTDNTDIISFDLAQRRVLGKLKAEPNLNWASITPSGRFVVVENNSHPDPNPQLLRYGADMQNELLLMDHPSHGDLALDDLGNDVHVMLSKKRVSYIRIKDRLKVHLPVDRLAIRFRSGHVSCRNVQRPGWCYISAYGSGHIGAVKLGGFPNFEKIPFALNAGFKKGPNAYEHWSIHHSSIETYASEAKASASPSGRQIIFSSDWYGTSAVEEFILALRQ